MIFLGLVTPSTSSKGPPTRPFYLQILENLLDAVLLDILASVPLILEPARHPTAP